MKNKMKNTLKDFGNAEGKYQSKCIRCKNIFIGDKRACVCKDCAIELLLKQYNIACKKLEKYEKD